MGQNSQKVEKKTEYGIQKHLVTGLLAHVDAGKTTMAEAILYQCGQIRSLGRVDHKDCFLDTDEIERQRGITIFSKMAHAAYQSTQLTLLDTPGHVDFSAEMERTLSVLDLAVLIISGADGVQGHTQTLWRLLAGYEIPTIVFVNKMDQPKADAAALFSELQEKLSSHMVDFSALATNPEQVYEEISVCEEELLEEYLETGTLSDETIQESIGLRKLFPVYFGSALHMEGITEMLSCIERFVPAPVYGEGFGARVFKITRDDTGKRLTHLKLTGGRLVPKQPLSNESNAKPGEEIWKEKADELRSYDGEKFTSLKEAVAGEIVAVTGLTRTFIGQGLGIETECENATLEPVLEYRLILPEDVDAKTALGKLKLLEEEDPKLHIVWQEEGQEIHIQVMGAIQMQILTEKILNRFDMKVQFGAGNIVYKETVARPCYGIGHFEPLRHYAEVQLLLEPGERGSGIQFASMVSEDVLSKNWQRLIHTHVEETVHPGVLTGSEVTDLKIILMTGRAHPKHTEGGDFRQATYRAIRNALRGAESVLLEPMYRFTIEVPIEHVGRALTDIERLHGVPDAPDIQGELGVITGRAPVATFQDYQLTLQAYTAGKGSLSLVLDGFSPCHNTEEVVQSAGYDPEADLRRPTGSVFCSHGAGIVIPWNEVAEYAHMECPIDLNRLTDETIQKDTLDATKITMDATDQAPKPLAGAKVNRSQGTITLEEIDAILGATFRKEKQEHSRYRRYHKHQTDTSNFMHVSTKPVKPKEIQKSYFLVDGYNVIFAWKELRDLAEKTIDGARDRLIDICSDYQGYIKETLILVFDAYKVKGNPGSVIKSGNIYVVFTKEAETADSYIEKATHELVGKNRVTVATSDRLEQMIIWGSGAIRMSAADFEAAYKKSHESMRETYLDQSTPLGNRPFEGL